ncbi:Phosphoadenosine phosphosulfate reductase [Pseudobythopirellula maris]|uniref:Adenosine 5'-phosphosulfate reductase n=1 Tax=Pseudobythopirellula maris TaxID=2527991 RepID=A0A5C5ZNJ8_9BACT|nr:phosphoadenylyl-sulfate reductase [Pseudobythopirellula maris]TWT88645.1 Phosphoadenosine phosphosulfate reductase [Pseudobythopirellula maris]
MSTALNHRTLHNAAHGDSAPPAVTDRAAPPSQEFLDELAAASASLEGSTPEEIMRWAHETYAPQLAMGTAFGPEGCLLLSMLPQQAPDTYVFNLETGYQFQQTLDLRDRFAEKYGVEVDLLKPELSVPEYEALHDGPLYKTNPTQCCFDRKIRVLQKAAEGRRAWIVGLRRDQGPTRANTPIVGWDKKFGLVKIAPLAASTKNKVWSRIIKEDVPYNPLHDQGYPSIGCWPCTQKAGADGDERDGRWAGTGKTECGLHTEQDGSGI